MFKLILTLFFLPFYVFYWSFKIFLGIFVFITNLISNTHKTYCLNKDNKNISKVSTDYSIDYSTDNIENYYEKLNYLPKETNIRKKEYNVVQATDTELRVTINKIEELYKELGFDVKVIDIIKKKYITEYEVIFSKEISQYEILSV